ncbi:hypothetical protein IFR04_015253 [Cadophora malorum]|uniref:Fungal N-terminal domain-containing protein n=1 Tax=Cadophora malorum TaxID=108018 RepID=A0A8H7SY14_9HELO|nr:hypothetical protein IFR04_015253 [Cadophora malorum]
MNVVASIAAVVGLVFNFATAIKRCNDIRGRYKGADQTISSIKQELEVLQSALQELANLMIHDPSALSSRWDTSKTLPTTFRRALNGFDGTITNLLRTLGRLSGERLRSIDRMKVVWNENGMEEHRRQLEGQTMALQLGSLSDVKSNLKAIETALLKLSSSFKTIDRDGVADFTYSGIFDDK